MNIVLTGLRGSGKSKIGKLLAKKLQYNFIDTDKEIEKNEKMSIKEIVELRGWEYFRSSESATIKEVSQFDHTVIATGGGAILDRDNEKELKKNGKIIYLYRKPEDCVKYIQNDPNRPPLTNQETLEEEMRQLYKERNDRYTESADLTFNRTEDAEKDAEELLKHMLL